MNFASNDKSKCKTEKTSILKVKIHKKIVICANIIKEEI